MPIQFDALEMEVLKLSSAERSQLLDRLVASLDADAEIQNLWELEAARRDADIDSGQGVLVPGQAVLDRLSAQLR